MSFQPPLFIFRHSVPGYPGWRVYRFWPLVTNLIVPCGTQRHFTSPRGGVMMPILPGRPWQQSIEITRDHAADTLRKARRQSRTRIMIRSPLDKNRSIPG